MQFVFEEGFLQADVGVEAVCSLAHVRADDAEFADIQIVQADLRRDADAPVHWLEGGIAVKKIERESQRLVEKGLFAAAKKSGTARLRGADAAWRGNAAPVERSRGAGREIQKHLLAQHAGPNRFVSFESVAIKRIEPARPRIDVLALLRIPPVGGLLQFPPVRDFVKNIRRGRKPFRLGIQDVIGVRIQTVEEDAVASVRSLPCRRRRRTKLGKARQPRASFDACQRHERNLQGHYFIRLQRKIGDDKRRIIMALTFSSYLPGGTGKILKTPSPDAVTWKRRPAGSSCKTIMAPGTGTLPLENPASSTIPSIAAVVCAC